MAAVLEWRLTGGATNNTPDDSLGGVMSANALSGFTALNNLFDNISPDEANDGDIEHRAIDLYNSGDEMATSITAWFSSQTSSGDTLVDMGKDATSGDPHAAAADLETIADEDTAPVSPVITFSMATSESPLVIEDIPVGQAARIWIRRTVSALAENISSDLMSLRAQYA